MSTQSDMSQQITEHKTAEDAQEDVWRRAFDLFDKDKDGTISLHELGLVLRSLNFNPTQKQVEEACRRLDKNCNGRCEYDEFKLVLKEMTPIQKNFQDEMLRAFQIFDQNKNKKIERKEIQHVLTCFGESLTEEELDYMMKYADLNGDGTVDYEEFVKLCLKPCF